MNNSKKISFLSVIFAITVVLLLYNIDTSDAKVDLDSLADEYEVTANDNFSKQNEKKQLKELLEEEKNKVNKDEKKILQLEKKIDKLEKSINEKEKRLKNIRDIMKKELTMEPNQRKILDDAEEILKNTDYEILPWSTLGVIPSQKSVIISIADEDPESYRELIEELVGSNVPVIIKQGAENPFVLCDSRHDDCSDLTGGLAIGTGEEANCTLGFPTTKDGVEGFVIPAHCADPGDIIYQPNSVDGEAIGFINATNGDWQLDEDCDCAFITMTSDDEWLDGYVYREFNWDFHHVEPQKVLEDGDELHISAKSVEDYVDFGWRDGTTSCQYGFLGLVIDDLHRASWTQVISGDSGSPVLEGHIPYGKGYIGMVVCNEATGFWGIGEDDDALYIPWQRIVDNIGVRE